MKPRVLIVHGWADDPTRGWMDWLAKQLATRNYEVIAPHFTETSIERVDLPAILGQLRTAVGELRPNDIFVGHSMGVSLILRMLMDAPAETHIRGLVLIAGIASSDRRRPNALFDPPLDYERLARIAKRRIVIHSDNDRLVLPQRSQELAELLHAEVRVDSGKGHFQGLLGLNELPSALDAILDC